MRLNDDTGKLKARGGHGGYHPGPRHNSGWDRASHLGMGWASAPLYGLNPDTAAHWVHDPEPDPTPIRGFDLAKVADHARMHGKANSKVVVDVPTELPDYVLVRAAGSHLLYQVEHTGTGHRLTSPKPLAAAKLALATMRSVMGSMGKVTA